MGLQICSRVRHATSATQGFYTFRCSIYGHGSVIQSFLFENSLEPFLVQLSPSILKECTSCLPIVSLFLFPLFGLSHLLAMVFIETPEPRIRKASDKKEK